VIAAERVLVTGAGGFVGANLVRRLLGTGVQVHALVRPGLPERLAAVAGCLELHEGDVTRPADLRAAFEAAGPDLVFHLAAARAEESPSARAATFAANVSGTAHLLAALAARPGTRLVAAGSSLEYGPSESPLDEDRPPRPTSFYGATKAAATVLLREAARREGRRVAILRPFFLYGPWQDRRKLVPSALEAALSGRELPLTRPGVRRDWLFVEDFVDACLMAIEADLAPGEVVNVASGRERTNEEVVRAAGDVIGVAVSVRPGEFPERPWDAERRAADVRRARERLGWRPRHSLEEGLAVTASWLRERSEAGAVAVP
jgi:UDP-glucose 4-epimerase